MQFIINFIGKMIFSKYSEEKSWTLIWGGKLRELSWFFDKLSPDDVAFPRNLAEQACQMSSDLKRQDCEKIAWE